MDKKQDGRKGLEVNAGAEQAVRAPRHGKHSAAQPVEAAKAGTAAKAEKTGADAKREKPAGTGKAAGAKKSTGTKKGKSKKKSGGPAFLNVGILKSKFYRVYFCVVIVALIAIALGMVWLNGQAADYELAQPVHVAEDVMKLFEEARYDELYGLDTAAEALSEGDRDFYISTMHDVADGKKLEMSSVSSTPSEQKYNVTVDGGKFASFTLVPSGMKTPKGRVLWQLDEVTTHLVRQTQLDEHDPTKARFRVKALNGCTVTVDGRQLTDEDVVARDVAVFEEGFLPESITPPLMTEYGFNAETDNPVISVADQQGTVMPVALDRPGVWVSGLQENEEYRAKYAEGVETLAKRLARYTSKDLSITTMLNSVSAGSPAEKSIKSFNNGWAPTHISYTFNNMTITDFYVLSEDCFTCHVSFEYVLTSVRNNLYPYQTEYTLCVIKSADGGKLYNVLFH